VYLFLLIFFSFNLTFSLVLVKDFFNFLGKWDVGGLGIIGGKPGGKG
jgi:hypothetical protein